ncbi:MAG: TolC family protein [Prevotella sp.]|nr:TolC family protein [Prevotella sp.]
MKNISKIIVTATVSVMLTGCGLYDKYQQQTVAPSDVFGAGADISEAVADSSMARLSWREFFTDPVVQQLIEKVLANNADLNSARIAIEKSETSLKVAKMAYLPSVYFAPQGSVTKFGSSSWQGGYNLPLQIQVDIDAFGSLTNKKRAAQAVLLQSQVQEEAIRANLVATVAQQYYMLQALDRQLEILTATDSLWNASLATERVLWDNGKVFSTAVNQLESSYLSVKTQVVDTRRLIRGVENAICSLMGSTPQRVERSKWGKSTLLGTPSTATGDILFNKSFLQIGVPAAMLQYRPDIRLANFAMEEAFYNTQAARSAFFPSINLQGVVGWTNNGGGIVMNPGKILLNAVASLTQPIFARGTIKANHKIAQLTEEDIKRKYVQTVIDAGNEVNEALADCQAAREKHGYFQRQVETLSEAYKGTHELMDNGKSNYLEVLTAQETLLNAQLSQAMNMYDGAQAVIALYIALGGGAK